MTVSNLSNQYLSTLYERFSTLYAEFKAVYPQLSTSFSELPQNYPQDIIPVNNPQFFITVLHYSS
jgi:hypothetical protein